MSRALSWNQWCRRFEPIDNLEEPAEPRLGYEQQMFETFGEDLNAVLAVANTNNAHVWTLIDCFGARGRKYGAVVPGYHLVNRLGYYITKFPWTDHNLEVVA